MKRRPPSDPIPFLLAFAVGLKRNPFVALHTHDAHEFFLCVGGRGRQLTDEGEEAMQDGDLFFFPAGRPHIGDGPPSGACEGLVINPPENIFSRGEEGDREAGEVFRLLRERHAQGPSRVPLSPAGRTRVRKAFRAMTAESYSRGIGYNAALKVGLTEALLSILRDPETPASWREAFQPAPLADRITMACRFLENRHRDRITVEQVARLCCKSRSHFHAVFRATTGYTLVEYVTNLRIKAAARMLAEGDAPIQEISHACGFSSLSHFYHVFLRRIGHPPARHRVLARKQPPREEKGGRKTPRSAVLPTENAAVQS
jgi:AraC-like DNA-binding protein